MAGVPPLSNGWLRISRVYVQDTNDVDYAVLNVVDYNPLPDLARALTNSVAVMQVRLQELGHTFPVDSTALFAELQQRSALGQLTPEQDSAMTKLSLTYMMLRGKDVTDEQLNAVWQYMNR